MSHISWNMEYVVVRIYTSLAKTYLLHGRGGWEESTWMDSHLNTTFVIFYFYFDT